MEKIDDPAKAETKVLGDMQGVVSQIRRLSEQDVKDVQRGIVQLRAIRSAVYEDLNQIQHEYLVLRGLQWLMANGFGSGVAWAWNPRQTGSGNEPDLRGSADGRIVLSAEASTSENPVGVIDSRMRDTLEKLSQMEGERFYFVCTDAMANRAQTKIAKAPWPVKVVRV